MIAGLLPKITVCSIRFVTPDPPKRLQLSLQSRLYLHPFREPCASAHLSVPVSPVVVEPSAVLAARLLIAQSFNFLISHACRSRLRCWVKALRVFQQFAR